MRSGRRENVNRIEPELANHHLRVVEALRVRSEARNLERPIAIPVADADKLHTGHCGQCPDVSLGNPPAADDADFHELHPINKVFNFR